MITKLLKQAVDEHELKFTTPKRSATGVNPKKRLLEDEFAIRFPRRFSTSSTSTTAQSLQFSNEVEYNDFQIAVSLQEEFNKEIDENPPQFGMLVPEIIPGLHQTIANNMPQRQVKKTMLLGL